MHSFYLEDTESGEQREREREGEGKGLQQRAGLWETELNEYFSSIFSPAFISTAETPAHTV